MRLVLISIVFLFTSCSLLRGFKKKEFTYTTANGTQKVSLLVPKRYQKEELIVDSAGNRALFYRYDGNAVLYFTYGDTAKKFQQINHSLHIPKNHPAGGRMYKGVGSSGLFWREVRQGKFRAGYRDVSYDQEIKFDTAVNHALWHRKGREGAARQK